MYHPAPRLASRLPTVHKERMADTQIGPDITIYTTLHNNASMVQVKNMRGCQYRA